mgnify:CR=1 FL=1
MSELKGACVIGQSGGPTSVINSSVLGALEAALDKPSITRVFGMAHGIKGLLNDDLYDIDKEDRDELALLRYTPSSALGSCRYKLPESLEDPVYPKLFRKFEEMNIGWFFYIGGNDSMDTVAKLSDYLAARNSKIRVIGIPKTIDNDLPVTDHTPGFGSAAKYVAATVQEIIRDSSVYSIESVTIVEIMGRHAGWLTASTCVLRANDEIAPHLIYLPENNFTAEKFLEDIRNQMAKHKAVIIAVSEGVKLKGEENKPRVVDNFGHEYLSGIGKTLEQLVKENIGCKVRSIELNVMQRCSSHICSKTDIDEAEEIGSAGVKAALAGKTGKMMIFKRISDVPYVVTVDSVDAHDAANKEKFFPAQWLSEDGNDVNPEAVRYFLPLIQGEVKIAMKNGMPVHFKL